MIILLSCFFLSGDRYLGHGAVPLIGARESLHNGRPIELCPGRCFSPFDGDIFRGQKGYFLPLLASWTFC